MVMKIRQEEEVLFIWLSFIGSLIQSVSQSVIHLISQSVIFQIYQVHLSAKHLGLTYILLLLIT